MQVTALVQSVAALLRRVQGRAGGLYPQDLPLGLTWGSSGAEDTGLEHELATQGPRGLMLSLQRGWHPTELARCLQPLLCRIRIWPIVFNAIFHQ